MTGGTITRRQADELLRFLPRFEALGRQFVRAWAGGTPTEDGRAITMPYPLYEDDVLAFFRLAGLPCWSDYGYEPRRAHDMIHDDELIRTCSLDELRTMLTYCVRGERFSDGHWAHLLQTGRIVALLRRLAALRDGLPPE